MKKILTLLLGISFGLIGFQSAYAEPEIPTIPEVSFSYASLHAIDHTHIVIPVSKGWHKDVGITVTPEPYGSSVGADKIVAGLTSGSFDVMSGSTVFSLAGYATNNNYRILCNLKGNPILSISFQIVDILFIQFYDLS